jgi:hypothetical protein
VDVEKLLVEKLLLEGNCMWHTFATLLNAVSPSFIRSKRRQVLKRTPRLMVQTLFCKAAGGARERVVYPAGSIPSSARVVRSRGESLRDCEARTSNELRDVRLLYAASRDVYPVTPVAVELRLSPLSTSSSTNSVIRDSAGTHGLSRRRLYVV